MAGRQRDTPLRRRGSDAGFLAHTDIVHPIGTQGFLTFRDFEAHTTPKPVKGQSALFHLIANVPHRTAKMRGNSFLVCPRVFALNVRLTFGLNHGAIMGQISRFVNRFRPWRHGFCLANPLRNAGDFLPFSARGFLRLFAWRLHDRICAQKCLSLPLRAGEKLRKLGKLKNLNKPRRPFSF